MSHVEVYNKHAVSLLVIYMYLIPE